MPTFNISSPEARIPYDVAEYPLFAPATTRAVGAGDSPQGIRLPKACILVGVFHRGTSADASGSTTTEIRRNGTAISGTSFSVAAASQVAGQTLAGLWVPLAAGDVLLPYVSAIGTTPGKGWYTTLHLLIAVQ